MKKITWNIIYKNLPTIQRRCPKCGINSEFISSNNFRVNANKNNLDVWLIYNCKNCDSSWNMDILSRVNSKSIPCDYYEKFLNNDKELAKKYAFDIEIHKQNKVNCNYNNLKYDIVGESIDIENLDYDIDLTINSEFPVNIRLDRILSEKLEIPRKEIAKLCEDNIIQNNNYKKLYKHKLNKQASLSIIKRE